MTNEIYASSKLLDWMHSVRPFHKSVTYRYKNCGSVRYSGLSRYQKFGSNYARITLPKKYF